MRFVRRLLTCNVRQRWCDGILLLRFTRICFLLFDILRFVLCSLCSTPVFFRLLFCVWFFCLNNCATLIVFRYASLPYCLVVQTHTLTHVGMHRHMHACVCVCTYVSASINSYLLCFSHTYKHAMGFMFHSMS